MCYLDYLCYTPVMKQDKILIFADHLARFYAERYGFSPVTGRLIGYMAVCEPMEQSINDIADALLTSRSAINGAVKTLEGMKLIVRTRPAGTRSDLISLNPLNWESTGFEASEYIQMAALAHEGLDILADASPERRAPLETMASLNEFLAERLPRLYQEWDEYRQQSNKNKE